MTQLVLRSLRSWLDQKIGQLSFPCLHKEDSNTFLETLAYTTLYKELCTIPSIRGAKIHHNGSNAPVTSLSLFTEQNDFESNQRWISESIFVHTKSDGGLCKAPNGFDGIHSTPMTHASVVPQITHFSPSKRRRVLFVEKDKQCWVELYEQECCISRVCAKELHDMPPHDEIFQRIIWDPCHENEIIYVAEPRHTALYPWEHCIRASENTPVPDSIPRRSKHEVTDSNWGEGLANLTETRLFSCNFSTQNIRPLPMKALGSEANERFSVGSPIALPFDEKEGTASLSRFLFLCIPHSDRKMGLLHCPTRPKFLCLWDHGNVFPIAREHLARVHCLAPSPCGVYLALFNVLDSKAHNAAHEVYILNLKDLVSFFACTDRKPETEECATFLESSRFTSYNNDQAEDRKDPQDFPGLYPSGRRSDLLWLDSDHVLVNSVRRSSNVLYSVNRNTGKWRLHTMEWGTWEVLDTKGVAVVVCFSSMNHCPTVLYTSNILRASQIDGASLPTVIGDNNSGWLHVYDSLRTQSIFRDVFREDTLTSEIHRFHGHHGTEVIVTQPKDLDDLRGTVIVVHGGPHGCDTNRFSYLHASLLLSRFRIFSVNYGGSVGFGQHRIEELGGKVGTHDVEDVIQSFMKSKFYSEGAKNVMMMGGSHGGFLSAHVSGQFPDLLCAASMRNPVINMSSMYYETDIPDWCIFESGSKNVQDMYNVSPIAWAHNVRTPTLIALGSDDYRVPAHQGRSWWHALRSRNVTVRLIEYPKLGHSLDSPSSEADYAIQTLVFFNEALEKQV